MALLTPWYEIEGGMTEFNELFRRLERLFTEGRHDRPVPMTGAWPRANLYDTGTSLTAVVQVPGMAEQEIQLQVQGDVLTVSGERRDETPQGYRAHRAERGARKFTRSFGLPCRVDTERTKATLRDGLLTVTMEKHPEAQPRKIKITTK